MLRYLILLSLLLPSFVQAAISYDEYQHLIENFEHHAEGVYAEVYPGREVVIVQQWIGDIDNAFAFRGNFNRDYIRFHGEFARHELMNRDTFLLVMCHELGHLVGGGPYFSDERRSTLTIEGMADYYASAVCIKKIFTNQVWENASWMMTPRSEEEWSRLEVFNRLCEQEDVSQKVTCLRTLEAGYRLSLIFRDLNNQPNENIPLRGGYYFHHQQSESHPLPGCRYSTYLAGALCEQYHILSPETGLSSDYTCMPTNNHERMRSAPPRCWYGSY